MFGLFKKRVPEIFQMEIAECGAACLCMILGYYGRYVPLSTLRKECKISRDGSRLSNMKEVAISYGFEAKAKRSNENLDGLHLPIIVFWNYRHYIVVEKVEKNFVYICDPALGRRKITRDEYNKCFTGIVLELIPTKDFVKGGKPFNSLKCLFSLAFEKKDAIVSLTIVFCAINVIAILIPMLGSKFIDFQIDYMATLDFSTGYFVYLIVIIFGILIQFLKNSIILRFDRIESATITERVMHKILKLPFEFFALRSHSSLVARIESVSALSSFISNKLVPTILGVFFSIFYIILICRINLIMGVIIFAFVIVLLLVFEHLLIESKNSSTKVMNQTILLSCYTIQSISIFDTIKSSAMEEDTLINTANAYNEYANANQQTKASLAVLQSFPLVAPIFLNLVVVFIGCYFYSIGYMTLGTIIACQSLVMNVFSPLLDFIMQFTLIQAQESNVRYLVDIIGEEEDKVFLQGSSETNEKINGTIEVEKVVFSYNTSLAPVINDISFRVERGKSLAIVGQSGCGKSTLLKLVEGIIAPTSGYVYYDGISIDKIDRKLVSNSLSVVSQTPALYYGTVRENITLFDNLIDMNDVIEVSKDALIYDDIMTHKDGFNTIIDPKSSEFSGGQIQRIMIARALIKKPSILILEEATSALDTIVEDEIMKNVKNKNITLIIVAHRLSTIRDCDEIIVLDKGKVVERGKHKNLIENIDGYYNKLVNSENICE